MQVLILIDGMYGRFPDPSAPPARSVLLSAGEVASFPRWYADGLIEEGRATLFTEGGPIEVDATPAARQAADLAGLDLARIEGTGKDGRVVLLDVKRALDV